MDAFVVHVNSTNKYNRTLEIRVALNSLQWIPTNPESKQLWGTYFPNLVVGDKTFNQSNEP